MLEPPVFPSEGIVPASFHLEILTDDVPVVVFVDASETCCKMHESTYDVRHTCREYYLNKELQASMNAKRQFWEKRLRKTCYFRQLRQEVPCTKRLKSSLVEFNPITHTLLGLHKALRCMGGTQNNDSEFAPRIHPSCICELSWKRAGDCTP